MGGGIRAVVTALAVASVLSGPVSGASASFPGRNGGIVVSGGSSTHEGAGGERTQSLRMIGGSGGRLPGCTESWGDWPVYEPCFVRTFASPSVSPDGRRVVFDTGDSLAIVEVATGDMRILPAHTADDGNPAFSPDGGKIVFDGLDADGTRSVYVREPYVGSPIRLTQGANPTWSSRDEIAFYRAGGIHVTDENGRQPRRLTRGSEPDWSPHGSKLAVVRRHDVYVVDLNRGGRATRVTRSRRAANPAWSPDGRWIAFERSWLGTSVIGARGGNPHIVERDQQGDSGSHASSAPSWQPSARR